MSRAVYRIVQELLTNAAKHAPGQTTTLRVRGNPRDGISIDATNGYIGGWAGGPSAIPAGLRGSPSVSSYLGAAFTTVLTTICSTSMWTSRGGDNHPRPLPIDHGGAATNRKR